jgi:O-antigen/teichoic acid export membrane protein
MQNTKSAQPPQTETTSFVVKLLKYLPSKALPALSAFITLPIISRLFRPEIYGDYILAETLAGFLVAATCSGFASGVLRFYPQYKKNNALGSFHSALNINLLMVIVTTCAIAMFVLAASQPALSKRLYQMLFLAVGVYAARALLTVYLEIPRALERPAAYTTFSLVQRYGSLAIGFSLILLLGTGIHGLLIGQLVATLLLLPFLYFGNVSSSSGNSGTFSWRDSKILFRWAWPLLIGNLAMWSLQLSDRYVLALLRPKVEVGYYSLAYQISDKSMNIMVSMFILSMIPAVINTWENRGKEAAQETLRIATRVYLLTALPASVGLAVLSKPILRLLSTEAYFPGHKVVGIVAAASFFWGLSMFAAMGLVISKRTLRLGTNQLVAAGVNLALNFALVPTLGFVGAAITTLIGYVLLFALQAAMSRREIRWPFPWSTLFNVVVGSGVMCVGLVLGTHLFRTLQLTGAVSLPVLIIGGILLYGACLLSLKELDRETLGIFNQVKRT